MNPLQNILSSFTPIGLEKWIVCNCWTEQTLSSFLTPIICQSCWTRSKFYKILQIGEERDFSYQTTYLDTEKYHFFYQHMSGRTNRYKVRYRIYKSTGVSYLEIKCKQQEANGKVAHQK
jgi:hypothetical protein